MIKKHPADAESERISSLIAESATRTHKADIILLSVCLALIFCFGILVWALPHSSYSEDENRSLTVFPEFSLKALTDGDYTADIGSFYSDQFPLRKYFVGLKAVSELAQLKCQNNNVLPASGGRLVKRLEYTDYSDAENNLASVAEFTGVMENLGIPVSTVLAPRSVDIFEHAINPLYGIDRASQIWSVAGKYDNVNCGLLETMRDLSGEGEYVWYRTDHHWTTLGAYYAYLALADELCYTAKPLEYFNREVVSDRFYGTTWSSSGMRWTAPDSLEFFRYSGDDSFVVENKLTGSLQSGFYDLSYLEKKDKYSAFLGGNNAYISVYNPDVTGRPKLLVIKDSYAHSLIPFLALHFDLEILDLRYYTGSAAALAQETGVCGVLILVGADNLAISDDLTLLGYGLSSYKNK